MLMMTSRLVEIDSLAYLDDGFAPDPHSRKSAKPESAGLRTFSYVGADPINFTDPTGLEAEEAIIVRGTRPRLTNFAALLSGGGDGSGSGPWAFGGGGGSTTQETDNCTTSVNGTPAPQEAARSTRTEVARRSSAGALAGLSAGPSGAIIGALLGYGTVAGQRAYQLQPGGSWDPRNGPAGNRLYGAVSVALGLSRDVSLRISGFIEQYGPQSNAPYDSANGKFTDSAGNLGNSEAAINDTDEGRACAE